MPDIITSALPKEAQAMADSTATVKQTIEQHIETLAKMPTEELFSTLLRWGAEIVGKLLLALVIYFVGRWLIKYLLCVQKRMMERRETDPSLRVFLHNLVQITLTIILISFIIGVLGIDTTSLVAIFASAGLAVGMALSGTLQNFAGGVMILLMKPFHVDDYVEMQGQSGKIKEIRLFHTVLNTPDNKTIMVPNGAISNGIINNYTHEQYRRVEWIFGVGYGEDYDRVKSVIKGLLDEDARVRPEPEPLVALHSLADSSVNIVVRAWVHTDNFWDLYFSLNEQVYKTFNQMNINIPFPQMDVHLKTPPPPPSPC
ncbi:MAG: mechanosensitive ion channel family protein [Rikenellaceae bacterium]|jgi:small conductance mechanosensitive channel|nr:mechanosensitive ion channel family protein [Rikenellaceae bacterium]